MTLLFWLAGEQVARADGLVAQSGIVKTMIGWLLVLLAIGLGLIVVCRPTARIEKRQKKTAKK